MSSSVSSLIIDIRPGERLSLHDTVTIELIKKSGRVARLRVVAPREVEVKKEGKTCNGIPDSLVASMTN